MSEKLRHAAQVVLEHYLSCNPLRSADVHDARCGCLRCKMDYLSEALDEKAGDDEGFQGEVGRWMLACFGPDISQDQLERADRFTEEALELAQTMPGFSADRAHALVDYVFGRPVGERGQEVGGVMVTLAALCNTADISIYAKARSELGRIWTKVEAIRAKQATKPTGSALPIATGSGRAGVESEILTWLRERERESLNGHVIAGIRIAIEQGAYKDVGP